MKGNLTGRAGKSVPLAAGMAAALLAAIAVAAPSVPAADRRSGAAAEADLKVVFLLNFARFVRWPGPAATNGEPFVVGVFDLDPLRASLAQLEQQTVRERAFRVRHCRGTNDISNCHILLVNAAEAETRKAVLAAVRDKPVLTVGENPEFLDEGGIILFVLRNDRLRLQISRPAAARSRLELSARLLEVAEKVVDGR